MAISFGYGFDMRNPREWHRPWPDLYVEHLDFIRLIEGLGFQAVRFAEHHGTDDGYLPSPLTMCAAVAARTDRIRVSPGIALAPFYHPVRLAEDMAVLDIISGGRAELCVGIGYLKDEAEAYGFPFGSRGRIADELLHIVRRLWQGDSVTFDGAFFRISDARVTPLPVQPQGIPIFVGGATAAGYRRAARLGDGYIGPVEGFAPYVAELRACGKDENAARLISMGADDLWFLVSEDPEKTISEVAPHAHYQYITYAKWQAGADWSPFAQMDLEAFKKSGALKVLTPADAVAHIRTKLAVAPIESLCLHAPAGFPLSKLAEHAELFAAKVMPAFR